MTLAFPETTAEHSTCVVGIFWHYVSDCGRYRVSMFRSDVDCSLSGIRWHASYLRDDAAGHWDQIARVRTRASAERHCRKHQHQARKQRAASKKGKR